MLINKQSCNFWSRSIFQEGLANGLAFSVSKDNPIPASLKNIYKEIKNDIGVLHNKDGSLEAWALQGVLLLNSCLTVEVSKPGSHLEIGWDNFIKEIIYLLNKSNLVFFFGAKMRKNMWNILIQFSFN